MIRDQARRTRDGLSRSILWISPLVSLFAGALLPSHASAQAVSGRVVTAAGEDPVAGATVTAIESPGRIVGSVITGDDGSFILRLRTPGEYLISAARLGFAGGEPVAVTVVGSSTVTLEIELREQAIEIEGVTATARQTDLLDAATLGGVLARRLEYTRGATRRVVMHTDAEFRNATRITHVLGYLPTSNRCLIVLKDAVPLSKLGAEIALQSHPADYLAIEWYRTWSDAPGTLRGVPGHILNPVNCTVIGLWARG